MMADFTVLTLITHYGYYVDIFNLCFGLLGNVLIVLMFTILTVFQRNQCAFYLYMEAMANSLSLIVQTFDRVNQYADGTSFGDFSISWCRARFILDQCSQLIPFSIICLTTFDQILSTNPYYPLRRLSTINLARWAVSISILLSVVHSVPGVFAVVLFPPIGCTSIDMKAAYYYLYFYYLILVGALPIFISSLFSLIAYRNVRRLVRRQIPVFRRRLDRQLTAMVFSRVIVFIVLCCPHTIYRIYVLQIIVNSYVSLPLIATRIVRFSVNLLRNVNYSVRQCHS